jgi:hypothetical protein
MRILWVVVALLVWAALSYAFIVLFSGAHVCTILQPVGGSPGATPIADDVLTAGCDRPDVGAIVASIVGLVAIVACAVVTRPAGWGPRRA